MMLLIFSTSNVGDLSKMFALADDVRQGLIQDLETRCPKLPILKFLGNLFFKGDQNILRLQL